MSIEALIVVVIAILSLIALLLIFQGTKKSAPPRGEAKKEKGLRKEWYEL